MKDVVRTFETACRALDAGRRVRRGRTRGRHLLARLWALPVESLSGWVLWRLERRAAGSARVGECRVLLLRGPHGRGLSVGSVIAIWVDPARTPTAAWFRTLVTHEYGHWEQAKRLGPLWPVVIGLPSLIWASLPVLRRMRRTRGISYYRLYTEAGADRLGSRALGHPIRR